MSTYHQELIDTMVKIKNADNLNAAATEEEVTFGVPTSEPVAVKKPAKPAAKKEEPAVEEEEPTAVKPAAKKPAKPAAKKPAKPAAKKPAKPTAKKPAKPAAEAKPAAKKKGVATKKRSEAKKAETAAAKARVKEKADIISIPSLELLLQIGIADAAHKDWKFLTKHYKGVESKSLTRYRDALKADKGKFKEDVVKRMGAGAKVILAYLENEVLPDIAKGLANDAYIRSKKLVAKKEKGGKPRVYAGGVTKRGEKDIKHDNEFVFPTWAGKTTFNTFDQDLNVYMPKEDIFGKGTDLYNFFSAKFAKEKKGVIALETLKTIAKAKGRTLAVTSNKPYFNPPMLGKLQLVPPNALNDFLNQKAPTITVGDRKVKLKFTLSTGVVSEATQKAVKKAQKDWESTVKFEKITATIKGEEKETLRIKSDSAEKREALGEAKKAANLEKMYSSAVYMVNKILIDTVLTAASFAAADPTLVSKFTPKVASSAVNSLIQMLVDPKRRFKTVSGGVIFLKDSNEEEEEELE